MKNYIFISLFLLVIFPFKANSQGDNTTNMLVLWENEIPPHMVSEYEKVAKKESAIFKKLNYPRSYFVYQTDDYHYWWVMQIKSFDDFEKLNQELGTFIVRMEQEEEFVFSQEFKDKTNFVKPMIMQWLPNLSNMPEGTMNFSQAQYFRWGFCYAKFGFDDEVIQNWEEWVKLFTENQLEIGWHFYKGIIGTENPFYMWSEIYDNPLDMETKRTIAFQNIINQSDKLWDETLHYLRMIDFKTGWYRPELSYVIENE